MARMIESETMVACPTCGEPTDGWVYEPEIITSAGPGATFSAEGYVLDAPRPVQTAIEKWDSWTVTPCGHVVTHQWLLSSIPQ